ncbi:MAG: CC_3452 family protein [Pseudomonadota bacterium]
MKLRMLTAVAVLSLAFTGAAWADSKVTASLKAPVAAKTKVVAAGAVFVCENDTCVALAAPARAVTTAGCKALAKEVGQLTAYGNGRKVVEGADLEACNAVATN